MYVVTKQAAVWVDGSTDAAPRRTPRPKRIQRWATRPLRTREGMVRALRFDGEDARVLVETAGRHRWVPLGLVMDEVQAKRWIRTGFPRGG